jgi:RimJ/RimL family protein N-acetyltransferase
MIGSSATACVTVARFYLRPARRLLDRARGVNPGRRTWDVQLGPVEVCGHSALLRSPRFSDARQWREVRLRERRRLEAWWVTSNLTWQQRHTEAAWISSLLHARKAARAGLALPLVVEVDGRLAGQFNLERIEPHTGNAELGIWLDSRVLENTAVAGVAAAILFDYAILELGLYRLTAPIADGNRAAVWGAQRFGMAHEGLMSGFLNVGGKRTDHHLWALTADRMPPGGMVKTMLEIAAHQRPPRRRSTGSTD